MSRTLQLPNEEETKLKLIIPLLQSRGVQLTELEFETTFSFQAGRRPIQISSVNRHKSGAKARLDILVKRNGRNLLIVEAKAGGLELTDDDRDQATSYARLVHPIAPYAIVTNGYLWKLFDSVSREELVPANLDPSADGLQIVLPQQDRDDALSLFLTASPENLSAFSRAQVSDYMKPLLGSRSDLTKKFVPELHVRRSGLDDELREFFQQTSHSALVVVGNSGLGKTCALCDLTLTLVDDAVPVIFFTGVSLADSLLDQLAAEFNWTFADEASPIDCIKRLRRLRLPRPVTIVVDAIDEWQYPSRVADLLLILRHASADVVRLVLSCKSDTWPLFLQQGGSPTGIEAFLHRPRAGHTISLDAFSNHEFGEALDHYRELFGFGGRIEDQVLDEAQRNPFLLRVAFQVACTAGLTSISFSATQLFEEYFLQIIRSTPRSDVAAATLAAVAQVLFEQNSDFSNESDVRSALRLSINDQIDPALFERNVLVRRRKGVANEIGFYFPQLQSFVAAFLGLRWPECEPEEFRNAIESCQPGTQMETVAFYYRHASEAHKRVVDAPIYDAALRYLEIYTQIVGNEFTALRARFPGCESDRVGFIGELQFSNRSLRYFGFRAIGNGDPPVLLLPADEQRDHSNLAYIFGAKQLHWVGGGINGDGDVVQHDQVLRREILPVIDGLLKGGDLIEDMTPQLAGELVVALIQRAGFEWGNPPCIYEVLGRFCDPRTRRPILPIDLDDIDEALLRGRYYDQFRLERSDTKRRERRKAGNLDGSLTWGREDYEWIEAQADRAFNLGEPFSERYGVDLNLEKFTLVMSRAIGTLRKYDQTLSESGFVSLQVDRVNAWPAERKEEVQSAVCALWRAFLQEYQRLLEVNFPTLKDSFGLYSEFPLRVRVMIERWRPDSYGGGSWDVTLFKSHTTGPDNEVIPCDAVIEQQGRNWRVFVDGAEVAVDSIERTSISNWTRSSTGNPLKVSLQTPLRQLVYDQLRREFSAARAELLRRYGVGLETFE